MQKIIVFDREDIANKFTFIEEDFRESLSSLVNRLVSRPKVEFRSEKIQRLGHQIVLKYDFYFAGKLKEVIYTDSAIYCIEVIKGKKDRIITGHSNNIKMWESGRMLFESYTLNEGPKTIKILELPNDEKGIVCCFSHVILLFSENGELINSLLSKDEILRIEIFDSSIYISLYNRIEIWDSFLENAKIIRPGFLNPVLFSVLSKTMIAVAYSEYIIVCDVENDQSKIIYRTSSPGIIHLSLYKGDLLSISTKDIRLWNLKTFETKSTGGYEDLRILMHINVAIVTPDDRIVLGLSSGEVVILDGIHKITQLKRLRKSGYLGILLDGRIINTSGPSIGIWNTETGNCDVTMEYDYVTDISFLFKNVLDIKMLSNGNLVSLMPGSEELPIWH